jgi:8-oxo-dGTP pyrophosphatase MutT (NUDIX family)
MVNPAQESEVKKYVDEAGAIVLRKSAGKTEILLILSKKQPAIRIFPKGHIESGESPAYAASRECIEEAGVEGTLLGEAGDVTYEFMNKWYHVRYYFFRYLRHCSSGETGRDPAWFSPSGAQDVLSLDNLSRLIEPSALERFGF